MVLCSKNRSGNIMEQLKCAIIKSPYFWLALYFSVYAVVLVVAAGVDIFLDYRMCELCMTQRLLIVGIVGLSGWAYTRKESTALKGLFLCLVLSFSGLCLGFWHNALLQKQLDTATCAIVLKPVILPEPFFRGLQSLYTFMPCSSSSSEFLGLTFPVWSILLHASMIGLSGFAWAMILNARKKS